MSEAHAQAIPIVSPTRQGTGRARPAEDALALLRANYPDDFRAVASYLYRRTGDHELAGELAAETFAHALASLARWSDRGLPLRCWLLRIATRRLAHHRRRQRRRAKLFHHFRTASKPASEEPRGLNDASVLREAVSRLPSSAQDVLYLHHVEGLPLRQIALILEVPEGTLKSRLARARDQLACALETNHTEHRHAR